MTTQVWIATRGSSVFGVYESKNLAIRMSQEELIADMQNSWRKQIEERRRTVEYYQKPLLVKNGAGKEALDAAAELRRQANLLEAELELKKVPPVEETPEVSEHHPDGYGTKRYHITIMTKRYSAIRIEPYEVVTVESVIAAQEASEGEDDAG